MNYRVLAAAAAVCLVAAGCGGSDETSESDNGKPVIRILSAGAPDFTGLTTEKWQQELEKAGYEAELKFVESPDDAARNVIAGAADFFLGSPPEGISAIQGADAPLKALAFTEQASTFVVVGDKDIADMKGLAGKKVALNTPGSTPNVILDIAMDIEGVDASNVEQITLGAGPARIAALQGGQVDATVVHFAEALPVIAAGDYHVIQDTGEILGQYLQQGLFVSTKFTDKYPEDTQEVIDIMLDSFRWAAEDKEGYMALADNYEFDLTDEQRSEAYDKLVANGFFPVNGAVDDLAKVEDWVTISQDAGAVPEDVIPLEEWLDNSFVMNYIEENGVA
jgi:ABC-type nitrate/sulfonate/bicarbonate transport system substrate-binding protein